MQVLLTAPDIACTSCAQAITQALSRLSGVQRVHVDVATKRVEVHFAEAEVTLQTILERLDEAGFPATVTTATQS